MPTDAQEMLVETAVSATADPLTAGAAGDGAPAALPSECAPQSPPDGSPDALPTPDASTVAPDASGSLRFAPPPAPIAVQLPVRTGEVVGDVVREIHERLAELLSHERELERRELELARWERRLEDAELTCDEDDSGASNDAGRTRLADLAEREKTLAAQAEDLARRESDLEARAAALREERDAVEKRRAQQRLDLAEKFRRLREREAALSTRAEAARAEIEKLTAAARKASRPPVRPEPRSESESPSLAAAAKQLAQDRQAIADHLRELESRQSRLEADQAALETQRARLIEQEAAIRAAREALEAQTLEARTRSSQTEAAAAEASAVIEAEQIRATAQAELNANRRDLETRWAALEQRSAELEAQATALTDRAARLDAESRACEDRAAELERRTAALAARWLELDAREEALQNRDAELAARERALSAASDGLAARTEQMDATRRAVSQQQRALESQRAELAAEQDKLTQLRTQLEGDLGRVRASLDGAAPLPVAAPLRRRAWVVLAGASAALGLGVGLGWSWLAPLRIESRGVLRVTAVLGDHAQAAAEHAARLLTPGAGALLADEGLAARWQSRIVAQRVSATPAQAPGEILLRIESPAAEATAEARLLADVLSAYSVHGGAQPREHMRPATDDRAAELAVLDQQRAGVEKRIAARDVLLATLPEWQAWEQLQTVAAGLETEYAMLESDLERTRSGLAGVRTELPGPAPLDESAVEAALAQDAMYNADLTELHASIREYQTELAVAMMVSSEPLRELRSRVANLLTAVGEQQALQPPPDVAAVLEPLTADMQGLDSRLAEFSVLWESTRQSVERHKADDPDATAQVQRQRTAADAIRTALEEVNAAAARQRERVASLTSNPDPGTRQVVVAAMLRGELGRIEEAAGALADTAKAVDLTQNARLDAKDHQVRGVATRIRERAAAVRDDLQRRRNVEEADRVASDLLARSGAIEALEQRRGRVWPQLLRAIGELREMGQAMSRRAALEAEQALDRERLAALQQEQSELAARPTSSSVLALPVDQVAAGPISSAPLDADSRRVQAGILGGLVFVLALGVGGIGMLTGRGRRAATGDSATTPTAGWPL